MATHLLERVNQELKWRSRGVRIFPNPKSCLRLFATQLKEWHEDWAFSRKYLDMDRLDEFETKTQGQAAEHDPMKEKKITVD